MASMATMTSMAPTTSMAMSASKTFAMLMSYFNTFFSTYCASIGTFVKIYYMRPIGFTIILLYYYTHVIKNYVATIKVNYMPKIYSVKAYTFINLHLTKILLLTFPFCQHIYVTKLAWPKFCSPICVFQNHTSDCNIHRSKIYFYPIHISEMFLIFNILVVINIILMYFIYFRKT